MSGSNVCRLCRSSCNNSIRLNDVNGRNNGVFDITSKYFDSKYLKIGRSSANSIAVLCMECWRRISVFNNFQQTALLLLDNLLGSEDQLTSTVQAPERNTNSLKVDHSSDTISIDGDDQRFSSNQASSAGRGNLIVTDCEIKFSTDIGEYKISESTPCNSSGTKYIENDNHHNGNPYDIDKDIQMGEGDVFIVDEFEQSETNTDEDKTNYENPTSDSPEIITPNNNQKKFGYSTENSDIIIAKWKPSLDCYKCHKKFPNFLSVKHHFPKDHPDDQFYIKCCRRKIKFRYRLEEHAIYHMNPGAYDCKLCTQRYTSKGSLEKHVRCAHSDTLSDLIKKRKNKLSNPRFGRCKYCPKLFTYRTAAYHHMKYHHPEVFAQRKQRRRKTK
ncbi:uncharacterized protein LOC142231710 isoform X1 [Haematobia irritans]|uniref:uncharacterized protein LOC142231710 isoform X1 n=1 Tax=Haematobia irritans TaxID=7368 RepID=UPI003F502557